MTFNQKKYALEWYHRNKDRLRAAKNERNRLWMNNWRKKNPELALKRKRDWAAKHPKQFHKWYVKNREHHIATVMKWREAHPEWVNLYRIKARPLWRKFNAKYVATLADSYVRSRLTKRSPIKSTDWPQELVELKRAHIKLIRLCRHLKTSTN